MISRAVKNIAWLVLLLLVVIGVSAYFFTGLKQTGPLKPGPNESVYHDPNAGLSFIYPDQLTTKYINAVDWPPKLAVINGPLICTEAGKESAQAGVTKKETIEGRSFCVTKESEGAAGSIYTQYAYAWELPDKRIAILTFSLRFPQCGNYGETTDMQQCTSERTTFNPDTLIGGIVNTFELSK